MKKKYRKVMALLLAVSMVLSGCAYGGLYADEVPAVSEGSPADAGGTDLGGMALGGTVSGGDAEMDLGGAVLGNDADAEVSVGMPADTPVVADAEEAGAYDWRASTSARDLYITDYQNQTIGQEYWGETIEELIAMYNDDTLEMNADWDAFFADTVFLGTDYESLLWLYENGYTLDGLLEDCVRENVLNIWQYIYGISLLADMEFTGSTVQLNKSNTLKGIIPAISQYSAQGIWWMKVGNYTSFCGDHGKEIKSGLYVEMTDEEAPGYVKKAFQWYFDHGETMENYVVAQIYIWCHGESVFPEAYAQFMYSNDRHNYSADLLDVTQMDDSDYTKYMISKEDAARTYQEIQASGYYSGTIKCWRNPSSTRWQRQWSTSTFLDTPNPSDSETGGGSADGEETYGDDVETWVKIKKLDSETGSPLQGVSFQITIEGGWLGNTYESATVTTDSNGEASFSVSECCLFYFFYIFYIPRRQALVSQSP